MAELLEQTFVKRLTPLIVPRRAEIARSFFKTKKGEYAAGDIILGITVPDCRRIARDYYGLGLNQIQSLLTSKIHEIRFIALVILVHNFDKANETERENIVNLYLQNTAHVNNWDLVDQSCYKILGEWLVDKNRSILKKLAKSPSLWERRIAIVSTLAFIRKGQIDDTLYLVKLLLADKHDLIHKATGWMLREAYKKNYKRIEEFIETNINLLPRTTLRYAIELMPQPKRRLWLKK